MSATPGALPEMARAPRWRLATASLLGALTVMFGVGLMASAGYLIARAAERPAILSLEVTIVAVRFFGLGRPVVRYLERLASHDLALRALGRVRVTFYERIVPLAPAQLQAYRAGDLLSRMVADVDALQNLYLHCLEPPIAALLAGAISVGVAAAILPGAGLVLAVGLLAAGLLAPATSSYLSARAGQRQAGAGAELTAELIELSRGAAELVAFGSQRAALDRVRSADSALVAVGRRSALATGAAEALTLGVSGATVAGVLAVSVAASADGRLDRVLVALLALLALASFEAVTPLARTGRELAATLAAGRRILELTGQGAVVRDPEHPLPAPRRPFAVQLEHVCARYPGQARPAIEDVSLRLEPGERVALLGPSGAGKTTIANLLLRFLDPEEGRLTLAGHDLRDYRQDDVRRAIAVAGQDAHLFSASIRDNVRLSRPGAGDDEVEDALRRARIWDWIDGLPDGLDTFVGEEGRELSGGQRQRIVLARALLTAAPVLVLDEPTAHLDPQTAAALVSDVLAAAGDRTVLLITHRTEGLDLVDRVVSL
ncbi:MAG: thiol reductant ABC exporter subunit CydC [Solirubrobacteraceae bacterium]